MTQVIISTGLNDTVPYSAMEHRSIHLGQFESSIAEIIIYHCYSSSKLNYLIIGPRLLQ